MLENRYVGDGGGVGVVVVGIDDEGDRSQQIEVVGGSRCGRGKKKKKVQGRRYCI